MNYPTIMPAITLDFQNSQQLDPRVTFSRSSSATYISSAGLVVTADENEARFEKDGLLLEESRTNLIVQSQALDTAPWVPLNGAIASSTELSPDGTANAWRFTASASQAFNRYIITNTGSNYTFSAFVKAGNVNWVRLYAFGGYVDFDLQNLVAGFVRPEITGYGIDPVANGWVRCWVSTAATSVTQIRIYPLVNSNDATTSPGDYIDLYGVQLELGFFPTSLILTAGSTTSRAADIAQVAGNNFSWYNQSVGTMQMTFNVMNNSLNNEQFLAAASSTNTGRDGYIYRVSTLYSANSGGGNNWSSTGSWLATGIAQGNNNFTFGYSRGSNATVRDGVIQKTNTETVLVEQSSATLYMMNQLSGHISRIAYYNERLTDAELQTLTS